MATLITLGGIALIVFLLLVGVVLVVYAPGLVDKWIKHRGIAAHRVRRQHELYRKTLTGVRDTLRLVTPKTLDDEILLKVTVKEIDDVLEDRKDLDK